jgi:hypothetical protein
MPFLWDRFSRLVHSAGDRLVSAVLGKEGAERSEGVAFAASRNAVGIADQAAGQEEESRRTVTDSEVCGLCECHPCRCGHTRKYRVRRLGRRGIVRVSAPDGQRVQFVYIGNVLTVSFGETVVTIDPYGRV